MNFSSNMEKAEFVLDMLNELNRDDPESLKIVLQKKSGIKLKEFTDLYNKLIDMHKHPESYVGTKSKTKGNVLEEIIEIVTIETNIFDLYRNVTNDTNEYDIIIKPSELAKNAYNAIPDSVYQPIICECKNYNQTIGVTWIGKLYMLLALAGVKLGIIFSYEGITGEDGWEDSKGLIKKIFLKDGIAILDFNAKDLEKIQQGERFYDIVQNKYDDLRFLTNKLEESKVNHPSATKVKELLSQIKDEVEYYKSQKYKKQ